jgi:hypothetical protein
MPTHFQLSWVRAVKEWNEHQPFHDDIYAIPKKGGDSYGEVVSLREEFKRQHNAPTQKEEPKPEPEPKPKPNPEPKPEPKVDAVKKYNDFLEKLKNESSGLKLKGMSFALTKEENKEYEELEKQAKEKSKNIKTVEEAKAFEKEQKKIQEKFKSKVYERNREESAKRFNLEKAANEARGIVEKPIEGKFFSFGEVFGSKKSEPKPEPKPEPIKSEDEWRGISEKSKLPDHEQKKGFQWLASKYNGLYASAVSKAKRIAQEGRPSFKTEKEYRDFVHLDFDAYGVDYREFFKDVLFADTQLYFYLQKNANKTKAPSYTSSAKEFRDWLKKH